MEEEADQQINQQELEKLIKNCEVVNGYSLIQSLSSGPMGKTFKCVKNGQFYVIKMMSESNSKNAKRQIEALKKLNNSNFIVKIVDSFEYNNQFCFVTEFYENESLFSYIRNQPNKKIEPIKALEIFRYILSGLLEMHELKILHRNIKVENIFIAKDGTVKICGLGICRELDTDIMTWSLCGTPSYSAPEILQRQLYNYKSDIWSLGVLLFAITTGQLPFGSNSSKTALYQKVKQALIPNFSFNNVKKNLKYPEKLDFGENNKEWENFFRLFFEERPSKRATYEQILNHNLVRPVLTAELPNIFNRKFDKLDDILQSVQFNSNDDNENYDDEGARSEQSSRSSSRLVEEQDVQQMLQSKMLASKVVFENLNIDFTDHVNVYNFEIYKYQILIDSYNYFLQKRFSVTLPINETLLLQYFLIQQILYHSLWIEHIFSKKKNQFKLANFEAFTNSGIYSAMMHRVSDDCRKFEDEFDKLYQLVKESNLDKKLPQEVSAAFVDFIFIDFNAIEYQKLPDFFKLPYRAVLMNCFQKIYLKSQRFLSFQEKVEDLMREGKHDKDQRREFSIKEGISHLRFALRLLVCCLINRVFSNQVCKLIDIKHMINNKFDLVTLLNSLTLSSQRAATQTISGLFKQYFPQFNLSNFQKEKFL